MAGSEVDRWWNVGDAPSVTEWCEKNVASACQALADSVHVWDYDHGLVGDVNVEVWCSLWEERIGKSTTVKQLLTSYAEGAVNSHYAAAQGIPAIMEGRAVDALKSIRDHIDGLLAEYSADNERG